MNRISAKFPQILTSRFEDIVVCFHFMNVPHDWRTELKAKLPSFNLKFEA